MDVDYNMQGLLATAVLSDEKENRKPRVTGDPRETTYRHSGAFPNKGPFLISRLQSVPCCAQPDTSISL